MANYNGVIKIDTTWTLLKGVAVSKNLALQYDSSASSYEIFCLDGNIAYTTVIFRGVVPDPVRYNQTTNDNDKADFEATYKDIVTNRVIAPSATYDGYAITTANPTLIAASDGSFIRTIKSDTSGRLITVGLGTAGTPAGGVISIQGVVSGTPIPISGTVTATNAAVSLVNTAAPASASYTGGSVTTAAPSYSNNTMNALSLTTGGLLRIDGSGVTQPVSGTVTANAGTGNFTVVQGVAASLNATVVGSGNFTVVQATAANLNATVVQATAANLRSQTASESTTAAATGTVASLTGGAVTTAAPTYTTGQMNPLSLTTAGALRIDGSAVTQPISGTVTVGNVLVVIGQSADNSSNVTTKIPVIPAVATTAAPSYTTGNMVPLSTDLAGALRVTGTVTAANPSVSATAAAPPASATYVGGSVTTAAPTYTTGQMNALSLTTTGLLRIDGSGVTQPVSGTVTAAQATAANLNATVVQGTAANLRSQTASESATGAAPPALAGLAGGSVTTAAPAYTTGQMSALSLTTTGLLRVDGSSTTQPVSGTVAATQSGTWNITNISGTISLPTGAATETTLAAMSAKLPAALVGGRLDSNIGAWLGSTAPTVGQKTMANSLPVAIASDQSALTVVQTTATNLNVTAHQGTTTIGNAWFQRITDGTNTAAVKAASAAAIATDPALVVAISPNNPITAAAPDTTVTGNLTALNTTVAIVPTGRYTVGGQILGTWAGTITAEGTIDGTTWFTVRTANKSTNDIIQTYTANDSFEFYSVAGCVGLRVRMSAYTSGTANIVLTATSMATDALLNYSSTENDGAPPLRYLNIATLSNDGTSHSLRNTNTNPTGVEFGLVTRSMDYGDLKSSFAPDPSSHTLAETAELSIDDAGNLQVRGQVLTDEGSFRDDFANSAITTTLTGTPSWTNASVTVTGTSTLFTTEIKSGDYIKKTADANTLYVRVSSVESDTSLTLETNYTGTTAAAASVRSNWIPTIGASGAIAVGTSNLTITTGTTSGVINSVIRRGDYGPITLRMYASISQRIANQELRIGFSDNVASLTPNIAAYVSFTGTSNTVCNFVTSSSIAVADTQTTAVTLPSGTTATLHEYKIDISGSQATLSIDSVVVARNTIHLPGPYDSLDLMFLAANTAAAGSSTTLTVDYTYFMNLNRVQIDTDFNGEGIYIQGSGNAGAPPTTGVIGAMAPDNSFSGAFTGLNSTWSVTLTGSRGVGFYLAAGTLVGTIVAEVSYDGTTWFATTMTDPVANISTGSLVFGVANGAVIRTIETTAGAFQARIRISAFTSGTANVTIRATQLESTVKTITSTDGNRTTYSAGVTGLVAVATPTDIFTISGSATRTIRVCRITFSGNQASAAQRDIILIKRSAANTGGTSATATAAPHDSNNAAATATVRSYTANPTGLGASVGTIRSKKVFIGTTTGVSDDLAMEFGTRNDQAIVLRGTGELLCINLNSISSGTSSLNISVTWTEE